jgi:ferritin
MSTKLSASMKTKQPAALRRSTTRALALSRMNSARQHVGDHEGFDHLRSYIKQGAEFSKELVAALNERADLETNYSKGLAKVSAKVFKAAKESNGGTVSNAWHFVAEDMEATAETHKSIASLLIEELVKPLKMFVEAQHKTRKSLESLVDKRAKCLNEWRSSEGKNKSKCYSNARDNERVQDQVLDCKLGRGRVLSDKELLKLDGKRKKSEEAVGKSDLDYYAACLKAERAR